ncbi:hypothetical protein BGZ95_011799 [Linnemannia exigua]|uniref:Uncharacterized protein n=1 Tax=Linnemannia exigua TaxID=604196 RepID=A0AAD4H4X9_9FUNG|nr:hypothetical protein BGZ95_011799 [Linnemannia exigua]
MTGNNPPKSPSVNNLISFWSDLDASPEGSPTPSRPRGPQPILNQQRLPSTTINAPQSTGPRSRSSPGLSPLPPSNPQRSHPAASPSIPTRPPLASPSPSPRGSTPLFPLRSVAPVQSKVFGTQRHALDTIHVRPLASPPAQAPRVMGPRAVHHMRPPPISTTAQSPLANTAATPTTPRPPRQQSVGSEGIVHPRTLLKKVGNEAGSATLRHLSSRTERPGDRGYRQEYRERDSDSSAIQHTSTAMISEDAIPPKTPPSSSSAQLLHSRGEEGIMKLALIPPVQSKENTWTHYHHPARSHPLVSASEPLGRPLDALLPLVKPVGDARESPAAAGLDRILSNTPVSPGASNIRSTQEASSDPTSNELKTDPRTTPRKAIHRPSSAPVEPVVRSSSPRNERRTKTSVNDEGHQAGQDGSRSGRGSDIMYAVVKGVSSKPAIPKLVGASGSGTVLVEKSRPQRPAMIDSEEMFRTDAARMKIDRRASRTNSQQTLVHSKTSRAETSSSSQSKRESVQSFTSLASTLDESIPEDSSGTFDDRDEREETSLLRKAGSSAFSDVLDKDSSRRNVDTRLNLGSETTKITISDIPLRLHEQKYAGGTPLGTKRSESTPENSTLDSSEALFQPTAPLISYPALDAYLSLLKPAKFTEITESTPGSRSSLLADGNSSTKSKPLPPQPSKSKKAPPSDPRIGMFPPLNKIPEGITLDELKVNITKPGGFFDQELQNVMLSTAVDGIMSGESSNIGISYMRIEIIIDFLQFVGLYLSVTGNTFVNQKWMYAAVNIIPAVLSLDIPRAVGYGMIFLFLFGLVCWIALYTFKIMTRADPNDDIEGLEVSSWSLRSKKQRIETISIVFLLTTLYLPLAKLAFDALVWSDTMWPIANPYTHSDFPELQPLGPSGIYRDPSDFCWVTSMKIQDLNFAYVIIPVAIFTLCANTFYFPLAIRRLVVQNLPRIDKYTEQGERRLDLDEEYKRLTNSDNCPYNFLYNGYRREHGTYKVVVMLNKLIAVVIVVLFSKDNCIFRGYERRVIESIRAGLQIVFTVSLIYRVYRTKPFLYASQNVSEYWSRACTVATSVIGLFIVLNAGSASVVNTLGIMLIATYVLMCIIVVWFSIRQTQKFQVMLKQIQQRLDFSLEIYNPRLNYFKHIKRRIWQETWTATLLVEDSFKMPSDTVVAYSQSPHRPPYLLNFKGTVAERHVENLRIVRQIGLRSYSQACQFLTPAMVRKRAMILKGFVGPDMYYAPEFMTSNIKTYFGKAYVVPFPFSVVFVYDESSVVVTLVKEHDLDRYIRQNQDPEIERRRELRYQLRSLDGKFVVRPFVETRGIQKGRESNGTMEMSLVNAPVSYKRGLFTIHRKKMSSWQGHNMNPGFSVTITYSDGEIQDPEGSSQLVHETTIGHEVIGITRDFQVTPALARLLRDNHALISRGVRKVKKVMQAYQNHYRNEALRKDSTLSYAFFINVYDNPNLKQKELEPLLRATEENLKVVEPSKQVSTAIQYLYERMGAVNRTRCHQWWYLFWDDLYRKNHEEIPQLTPKEFSPAFPGSICYRPMARPDLEAFLEKQGCWLKNGRAGFMNVGVLNRIYTFLNVLVFDKMTKEQRQRQLEMTTVERQRLEQLFLVTKANVHTDGTYKRMPLMEDGAEIGAGQGGLGRKSSKGEIQRKKSRMGWFESITPGRRKDRMNKQPLHEQQQLPGQTGQEHGRLDYFSPGYIIPQTWQQKASQFTALLIGGRPDDMIGESDEEDDLEESDEIAQKRRRTMTGSMETIPGRLHSADSGGHGDSMELKRVVTVQGVRSRSDSNNMSTEQQNPLLRAALQQQGPQQQSTHPPSVSQQRPLVGRPESWASISTLAESPVVLNSGSNSKQKHGGGVQSSAGGDREKNQQRRNPFNRPEKEEDQDDGVASDTMSITSMSSEDYW